MINLIAAVLLSIALAFNFFNGDAEWVVIDSLLLALNLPPAIVWWHKKMK